MKRNRANRPLSTGVERNMARYVFAAASIASIASATSARADFSGPYDPVNWLFGNTGASNGTVDTSLAPVSITLTGGELGGFSSSGTTNYTIAAVASGTVSFDWTYSSSDSNAYDIGNFLLEGAATVLATNATQGSGSFSSPVVAGNVFGFQVFSLDQFGGPGVLTISNFSAPIPEPATLSLLALGAAGVAILRRRRRLQVRAKK